MDDGQRTRTALFVDFDNVFRGLLEVNRDAAFGFAEEADRWLGGLAVHGTGGGRRDVLVRRAYLNPNGWVADAQLGNDHGRVYLSRFRQPLIRAGFEVVDCPALTSRHKNAADIRIVLDVIAALDGPTHYDEFVIGSSDSDFTPLLHRLRAADRRTVVIAAQEAVQAYGGVADLLLDADDILSLVGHVSDGDVGPGASATIDLGAAAEAVISGARAGDWPASLEQVSTT